MWGGALHCAAPGRASSQGRAQELCSVKYFNPVPGTGRSSSDTSVSRSPAQAQGRQRLCLWGEAVPLALPVACAHSLVLQVTVVAPCDDSDASQSQPGQT